MQATKMLQLGCQINVVYVITEDVWVSGRSGESSGLNSANPMAPTGKTFVHCCHYCKEKRTVMFDLASLLQRNSDQHKKSAARMQTACSKLSHISMGGAVTWH